MLESIRASLPDEAKDIKLNLQAVLSGGVLTPAQRWGVVIAAAASSRVPALIDAAVADAASAVDASTISDAKAAAVLMAMNNVFYRFRYMIEKPSYEQKPARLRMNRLVQPAGNRIDFELFALAVSAINGCKSCVAAHEDVVLRGGLTEDHVHEAVRIAATIQAVAVAMTLGPGLATPVAA
jgi:alkyl hydroperoxide reductase subunit D